MAKVSYANQAGRQLLKERQDVATLQLPADNHLTTNINAAHSCRWRAVHSIMNGHSIGLTPVATLALRVR